MNFVPLNNEPQHFLPLLPRAPEHVNESRSETANSCITSMPHGAKPK